MSWNRSIHWTWMLGFQWSLPKEESSEMIWCNFYETLGVCGSTINYDGDYFKKVTPKSLLLNIWAAKPVEIRIRFDHFKVRDPINKTNGNSIPSKWQKKKKKGINHPEYLRPKYLILHILEEKYDLLFFWIQKYWVIEASQLLTSNSSH